MVFEKRYEQCRACRNSSMCKWSEIYYKNKGEWPDSVPRDMVVKIDGSSQCAHAPFRIYGSHF